ncbi:MAG: hypothetical protein ACUVTH_11795 [Thermogutta sp.]
MKRRDFLHTISWASVGTLIPAGEVVGNADFYRGVQIESPRDGAVLNWRHGRVFEKGLEITVVGRGPEGRVVVNGVPADRDGERFVAKVVLDARDVTLRAVHLESQQEHSVRVRWDRHSFPRYRFAIDDNSFFLRDIWQKKYSSLFDCFYLAGLRDLHRRFGTKFVLNIYWTTGDDFSIDKFPDGYKTEWQDNADWLRLAFHAWSDKPERPYQDAPVEKLLADLDRVANEIVRFAGENVYSPTTIIHWGMVRPEAFRPLTTRGIKVLSGYFRQINGQWDVNYRLSDEISEYLFQHDAWIDYDSGMTFSKIDIVVNLVPLDQIPGVLEAAYGDPNQAEVMDLMTHEQHFWPFYTHYIPEHFQRLETAIRWVTERGYRPVFLHEGFLGAPA